MKSCLQWKSPGGDRDQDLLELSMGRLKLAEETNAKENSDYHYHDAFRGSFDALPTWYTPSNRPHLIWNKVSTLPPLYTLNFVVLPLPHLHSCSCLSFYLGHNLNAI